VVGVEPAPRLTADVIVGAVELETFQVLDNDVLKFLLVIRVVNINPKTCLIVVIAAFGYGIVLNRKVIGDLVIPLLLPLFRNLFALLEILLPQ
jgi:hypothetical protein